MKEMFDKLFSGGFFADPFSTFGWRDILDIVCLAALFFALYLFVRDRRAGKLLVGVAIVVVMFAVSELLDMYAIRYILDSFFGYGLVVLAIIFQPELRAAMERIGSVPFNGLKTIGAETRELSSSAAWVNAIVEATKNMSFSKTGALIVIERSTKIGEYISTGTTINAELSPELLCALFVNKAPLHDGAVIIRNGRLFAAGCYLPLSDRNDIFKSLGTRHRAAIGLSEQSDAIVVVVSEETGTISIAYRGELFREFTSVSLRRKLFELLRRQEQSEN
ncbi:MAG: diadenylate cyclase CdaA [Clostridia bacterium]|nr:diadenylate cyclase CdaA [Clostridia bacterium]